MMEMPVILLYLIGWMKVPYEQAFEEEARIQFHSSLHQSSRECQHLHPSSFNQEPQLIAPHFAPAGHAGRV